ncbi:PQQ-binding-like beta-propeller repeat protein [candidate division KSB1 bacterium]|nr:PQQ-binding-like beta-propeller repeat protein [candidate division KSB1 bacterium]NIR69151.1 PQQ-binding-like beta-propeller repeat protein [candidate division KSB1 bacterium]NIS25662.1 PQQ-binding-like beta-propeller repeat protein [candidate division KSB1 bacterium]NIT72530.1 PQQ-binding-like beta-propeller repeat protein [candidate division KSB1 bacterium]NIU26339.1 PQQ-binding-like beta-propeller repeat protein [candidate division KSB1 bacterium]
MKRSCDYLSLRKSLGVLSLTLMLSFTFGQLAVASDSDRGKDWPKWRGQKQDGKAHQTDVFKFDEGYGLEVTWKKPLGSGYSSISIADGRAVTMFSDSTFDYVIAFDTESGDELWRYKIDSTYIGHDGSHNGQISTPTIDGDKIFVYARKGQLLALDAKTGKKIWARNIKNEMEPLEPFHGFGSSPVVVDDILFCQAGIVDGQTLCGFNKQSGELLWSTESDTINYQSPIVADLLGEKQIVSVSDHHVYGVSPESGNVLWKHRHNGNGNAINPVVVDNDKIFLNHNFRRSGLFQLTKENGQYAVEKLWENRNIRQTHNTTVYHDGYLYGYSSRFLTCVDPTTGETVWKSRPPGDGFLILVDDHLVILTKQGTMHVAEASPEDYKERASLQVFDGLTWSPPSFAYGNIYARNLYEIARIDVAPVDQLTMDEPEIEMLNPDGEFAKFVKKVQSASSEAKKPLVDEFMKSQKRFPVIEDNRFAHIIYRGEAKDVAVVGDMLNAGQEVALNRIDGTNFFFSSFELEPDARVNYQLRKDFDHVITDPLNPHTAPGGPATMQGQASELRIPKWDGLATHFQEPKEGVARGTIQTFEFESKILNNTRNVHVYLPTGYENSNTSYPVVYVNYGGQAKDSQQIPNTLDNLIASERIQPVIAVFVEAPQSFREYSRNLRDQHAQMYAEELVPHIDQKFRTKADADSRAVMGGDEGGFAAFYVTFKYPNVFRNVAGQSTHLHRPAGGDQLTQMVRESSKLPVKIYMDWGKYDLSYPNGLSWVDLNRAFVELLKEKGYSVAGGEYSDGFGWGSWRYRTDEILEHFFALK